MSLINNLITRFPNGVTNRGIGDILNSLRHPDTTMYHEFLDDFDRYTAAQWVVTAIGTSPVAAADGDNGILTMTTGATSGNGVAIQNATSSFLLAAGRPCFFKTRLQISVEATLDTFLVGLQIADTTPFDAVQGVYFIKPAAANTLNFIVRKDATTGSNTATAIATILPATNYTLGWYFDGVDRIYYSVNGTILGFLDASATFLPTSLLTVSAAVANGEAVAKVLSLDYLFVAEER